MKKQIINDKLIENFLLHLISEERSAATISKYQREVQEFRLGRFRVFLWHF